MAEERNQLKIEIRDKVATLTSQNFRLVGGNSDYEVVFDFDEDWANYPAKTAMFVFGNNSVKKPFDGNICEGVAVEGATAVAIGVFAGDIVTSKGAYVCCELSIRDMGETPREPTKNEYDELMELLNRYINSAKGAPSGGVAGQVLKKNSDKDYDYSWQDDEMRDLTNYYTKKQSDERFATPAIVGIKIEEYLKAHPPKDGISPTITIVPIENGHRVTITDINGAHTFDVLNGAKGEQGIQGEKGESGYTPQRGTDYWTETDVADIEAYIDSKVAPILEEVNGVDEILESVAEGGAF